MIEISRVRSKPAITASCSIVLLEQPFCKVKEYGKFALSGVTKIFLILALLVSVSFCFFPIGLLEVPPKYIFHPFSTSISWTRIALRVCLKTAEDISHTEAIRGFLKTSTNILFVSSKFFESSFGAGDVILPFRIFKFVKYSLFYQFASNLEWHLLLSKQ